jgi:hypothetical protein
MIVNIATKIKNSEVMYIIDYLKLISCNSYDYENYKKYLMNLRVNIID